MERRIMRACSGCELLPQAVAEQGVLYLCPPLGHTVGKIREASKAAAIVCDAPEDGILAIKLESCESRGWHRCSTAG